METTARVREKIREIAKKRVLILDGAMGSLIQEMKPKESAAQSGECNDLLCLTMPDIISGIHEAYLKAGADIIETCSFNANAVSLADYGKADLAYETSAAAARLARKAADSFSTPDKPRFVAGSMGPTSKSASIPPDFNEPGKRAVSWDALEAAYYDNARGLLDGGADVLLIETVIDTLNAKAAIFAVKRLEEERGIDVPVIVSATISDGGGRLLTGQTVEAFCVSVLHADPLALGLNCSFGAEKLKPYIAAVSAAAPCLVCAYPNAGLPNRHGAYDESPESMAGHIEDYLRNGLVNIVGGCCGSTPAHIAAIAARAEKYSPRQVPPSSPLPSLSKKTVLSGLEVMEIDLKRFSAGLKGRKNTAEDSELLDLITQGKYEDAVDIVRDRAGSEIGEIVEVRVDDTNPEAEAAITGFLNFALQYPDLSRFPVMIESSRREVIEAGLKCLQGRGLVNFTNLKESGDEFFRRVRAYGALAADSP